MFNFSRLTCLQRPVQLLAKLGAVGLPTSSGQVEVIQVPDRSWELLCASLNPSGSAAIQIPQGDGVAP